MTMLHEEVNNFKPKDSVAQATSPKSAIFNSNAFDLLKVYHNIAYYTLSLPGKIRVSKDGDLRIHYYIYRKVNQMEILHFHIILEREFGNLDFTSGAVCGNANIFYYQDIVDIYSSLVSWFKKSKNKDYQPFYVV